MTEEYGEERTCAAPGCDELLPEGSHKWRKYCDEHQPPKVAPKGKRKAPPRDRRPPSININLPGRGQTKKDAELETLQARAEALANGIAAVLAISGRPDDGLDIQRGAKAWAMSVRQLGVHEEWVRKLAAGGEASERAMAWVGFAMATGAIAVPIMIRHGAMPTALANIIEKMAPTEQAPSEPDAEPVAA